jgi:hypothetical protein
MGYTANRPPVPDESRASLTISISGCASRIWERFNDLAANNRLIQVKAWLKRASTIGSSMDTILDRFVVRFDQHAIHLLAHPPNEAAWEQQIAWEQITRVGFRAGRWPMSGDLFLSTSEMPDGYQIPIDADGGKALWSEIRARDLFSDTMTHEAAGATGKLFCSPRRTKNGVIQSFPLFSPRQLPDLDGEEMALTWDQDGPDSIVRYGDMTVWRERTGWEVYDRFEEIALILKHKYGSRLVDLVPTPNSMYALLGDSLPATFHVADARKALGKDAPVEAFFWLQLQYAIRAGDNDDPPLPGPGR